MAKNNYPQAGLDEIEPAAVQQIVSSLKELHDKGRPKTDEEVEERINEYFSFCERSSIRPGIESLSTILPTWFKEKELVCSTNLSVSVSNKFF